MYHTPNFKILGPLENQNKGHWKQAGLIAFRSTATWTERTTPFFGQLLSRHFVPGSRVHLAPTLTNTTSVFYDLKLSGKEFWPFEH